MNLAELHDELERLGSRPVPVLDDDRIAALEERLLGEFAASTPVTPVPTLASARRRRRQVLAGGMSAAAAALALATVLVRTGDGSYEVSAATGAVAIHPDGVSRPVEAGDRIPVGGLIMTGPVGAVTIEETTVGADHVILLDEENIAVLPAGPAARSVDAPLPAPTTTAAPTAPPSAAPVTLVPTIATPAPPAPAALNPAPLSLSVTETADGVQLSWTPTDATTFERYIVVRGTADSDRLVDVAELPGLEATSFLDTTPPTGVELCYKVVAVDATGLPVAVSETITILVEGTGSSNEIPPSSAPAPTTTTTKPGRPSTSAPETTVSSVSPPVDSAAPTTAGTDTAGDGATTVAESVPDTAPTTDSGTTSDGEASPPTSGNRGGEGEG